MHNMGDINKTTTKMIMKNLVCEIPFLDISIIYFDNDNSLAISKMPSFVYLYLSLYGNCVDYIVQPYKTIPSGQWKVEAKFDFIFI